MSGLNPVVDDAKGQSIFAYEFGAFRIDVDLCRLTRNQELVALSPKAFDALLMLVDCRNRVVSKDELMRALWPDSFVSDDSLTQIVSVLRRALGDVSSRPELIVTVPRRGYRFAAPVIAIQRNDGAPAPVDPLDDSSERKVSRMWTRVPWMPLALSAGAAATIVLLTTFWGHIFPDHSKSLKSPIRFVLEPPADHRIVSGGVFSPDGAAVAFVAQHDTDPPRLWIHELDKSEPYALPGTDHAYRPFWAPDSRSVAFFAYGKLRTVDLVGNPPQTVADVSPTPAGGTWNSDGTILFADRLSALYSVSVKSGEVKPVTRLDPAHQERRHRWPQFLPDGRHFLYFAVSDDADREGTYVGSLDSPDRIRILNGPSPAMFAPPDRLLYVRDGALVSQPFDSGRLRLTGPSTIVATDVTAPAMTNGVTISATPDVLTFGGPVTDERLTWFARDGHRFGSVDAPGGNPMFSPDRHRLLVQTLENGRGAIWLLDDKFDSRTRVVPNGAVPAWSPDGVRIAYTSGKNAGVDDIFVRPAKSDAAEELVLQTASPKHVSDWSPDGRYIVYVETNPRTKLDVWLLPMFGDRRPVPFLVTSANEMQAQVSPDGHWIAYASDESGQWEIYVQPFPTGSGQRHKISTDGGVEPQWRPDGRELFYLDLAQTLTAVPVLTGDGWHTDVPQALFRTAIGPGASPRNHYAVGQAGQRFLISSADGGQAPQPITFLVNWTTPQKP
jgi:DNA-binding winged helix-turn-helix (wHTH) protein/Tol biopolymer transport system component